MKHSRPGFGVIHDDGDEAPAAAAQNQTPNPANPTPRPESAAPRPLDPEAAKRLAEAREKLTQQNTPSPSSKPTSDFLELAKRSAESRQPQTEIIPTVQPKALVNAEPIDPRPPVNTSGVPQPVKALDHPLQLEVRHG